MWIPDEAVEAATGVEIGDLNETVEAPWHLQPEEARQVLEAAMPHMKDATPRLTRRQSAILGAFTGISCGPFEAVHEYAEKKLGRPVWTHEFASKERVAELKEAAREDFLSICYENEDTPHLKETDHE